MLISIICSNYNSSFWIDDYLNSLNNQLLNQFEVVFIDANSSDNSLTSIKSFLFREGITKKIIEKTDRIGVYEAWNEAIINSNGDFVVNYNTDDYLFPSSLIIYDSYIKRFPKFDLFYGNNFVHQNAQTKKVTNINLWPNYDHEILKKFCFCGPFPAVRKQSIINAGMFDKNYISSGDYDMWLKLSSNKCSFFHLDEVIGSFFYHHDSLSNSNLLKAQQEDTVIQSKY